MDTLIWILLNLIVLIPFSFTNPVSNYGDRDCVLDHDGTNAALDACLSLGEVFIREYLRSLDRNKIAEFNTCYEFQAFGHCITDLWKRCPTIQQVTYKHWKPVVDLLKCSCNTTIAKHECHHERQCLEAEFTGALVRRADELYEFNIKQKTRDKCVFLREKILSKTSLVQSACGDNVGLAAYSMAKINDKKTIEKSRCYITLEHPYHGFTYSTDTCARDFKDEMQDCYVHHLEKFATSFRANNNLIADGKLKDLREMCSGWREYKHCTRGIRAECKQGVELVYEQNGKVRSLLLKLDYICKEAKEDYQANLYCLQKVMDDDALSQCNDHWEELDPWLNNITSYEFYCQAHNPNTKGMVLALEELRHCFEVVFSYKCNVATGSLMSELIRRAFGDPFYLRFAYRADCDLHKIPSSIKRSHTTHRYRHEHKQSRDYSVEQEPPIRITKKPHVISNQQEPQHSDSVQQSGVSAAPKLSNTSVQLLIHFILSALLTLQFNGRFVLR